MDWNIFFSSIAQAFASLLGVVLAFIISKILNEAIDYDNTEKDVSCLILEVEEIKRRVKQLKFVWHDKAIWEYDYKAKDLIRNNRLESSSDIDIIQFIKSNLPDIYDPESILDKIKQSIQIEQNMRISSNASYIMQMARVAPGVPDGLWSSIAKFEEDFSNFEIRAQIIVKKIANSKNSIARNVSDFLNLKNIIIIFLPLITLTIIYPLHFLPIAENSIPHISFNIGNAIGYLFSIRGLFISILFIVTSALIIYFYTICVLTIKKYKALKEKFNSEVSDIKYYCKYFQEKEI